MKSACLLAWRATNALAERDSVRARLLPRVSESGLQPGEISAVADATRRAGVRYTPRSRAEVAASFTGSHLVDPGVVAVLAWRRPGRAASRVAGLSRRAASGSSAGLGEALLAEYGEEQ